MFLKFKALSYFIFLGIFHVSIHTKAQDFHLMMLENPPFGYTDPKTGKPAGSGTELIEIIFKNTGITYTIVATPWNRAHEITLKENKTCFFMAGQMDKDKDKFKWVGPFLKVEWAAFVKEGSTIKISSMEDLKNYRIGGYSESPSVRHLKNRGIDNIQIVSRDSLNVKKLKTDRIDVWVTNNLKAPLFAKKEGLSLKKLYVFKNTSHYMACNKQIPDATIDKLNKEVDKLRSTGKFEKTFKKYSEQEFE